MVSTIVVDREVVGVGVVILRPGLITCEGLSAATKLNTARLINEDIMCTTECTGDCNMMEEITELMLN